MYTPVSHITGIEHDKVTLLHSFPPPEIEKTWRDFLVKVNCPSAYDTPEFFLEPHWEGQRPFAVLAWEGSAIIGVLTGIHTGGGVTCGLTSRPQVRMASREAELKLLHGLLQEAGSARIIEVFTWHSSPLPMFEQHGFRRTELQGDVVLDLRLGPETLFQQFHSNRKRNIRAAVRNGIVVCEAAENDFEAYWNVYCAWQKTKRKKIHAHNSFARAQRFHQLTATHRRFLARYQDKVIAATTVRFCPGGLIEYASNCSLDDFNGLRPNDLLIWSTIQWACHQGFPKYSLGAAHPFLAKCGGSLEGIDRYRLDRTPLKYYEFKDKIKALSYKAIRALPTSFREAIARLLHKRVAAGD